MSLFQNGTLEDLNTSIGTCLKLYDAIEMHL